MIGWKGIENRQPIGRSPECSPPPQPKTLRTSTALRVAASVLSVVSYVALTRSQVHTGASLNLVSQALIVPFAAERRAWDMVGLSALFGGINLHLVLEAATKWIS